MKRALSRARRALPALAALCAAGLFGPGCSSLRPEPNPTWVRQEFDVTSSRLVWEYAVLSLEKLQYPVGSGLDPTNMVAETGWKNTLLPFKSAGYRQKAVVEILPVGEGRYEIGARVMKQTNEAIVRPTDLRYAEWQWTDDDHVAARIVLQHIRSYVSPSLIIEEKVGDLPSAPEFARE